MRTWWVVVATVSLAMVQAVGSVAGARQSEEARRVIGVDMDGDIRVEEIPVDVLDGLDHSRRCTFSIVTNSCTTGHHDGGLLFGGLTFPSGTTIGDFQTTMIGDDGNTAQFQCSFSFVQGQPVPGTPGVDCRASPGSSAPTGGFTHDCYAYPLGTIGAIAGSGDPSDPGPGAPGWINQPEDSVECVMLDVS